jgi:hypothetical protein
MTMTLPEYFALCEYWREAPPEHEVLAMLASVYTTWEPERPPMTEAEAVAAHRKSLEDRWRAGAMNPAQMLAALGGRGIAVGASGVASAVTFDPKHPPGVGPFPGAH